MIVVPEYDVLDDVIVEGRSVGADGWVSLAHVQGSSRPYAAGHQGQPMCKIIVREPSKRFRVCGRTTKAHLRAFFVL